MSLFLTSLVQALRGLRRTPGFAAAVLLTLALGIGANTALFSLTHGMLLRPLPYPGAGRMVALRGLLPRDWPFPSTDGTSNVSAPNFFDWREEAVSFEGLALYAFRDLDLADAGGAERVRGMAVSAGFFELLGARPLLGRTFDRPDEAPEEAAVAVLSHGLWIRRFGAHPGVLGQTIHLGGRPRTIVGVLAPGFRPPDAEGRDVFLPLHRDPAGKDRTSYSYQAVARLKPGVGPAQARAEMRALAEATLRRHPECAGWMATAVNLHRYLVGDRTRPLLLLQGAVLLLLLIACANVANLLLVRSTVAFREAALRSALGASRGQLAVHHLAEGLVIGLGGGGLGAALACGAIRILPAILQDTSFASALHTPEPSLPVLGFALALSLAASICFALVPVLQAWRGDLRPTVQREAHGTPAAVRLRGLLVAGQVALATVLLLGMALLLRSFVKLVRTPTGFDPHQVIAFQVVLPASRYGTDLRQRTFTEDLVARLQALPGAERAAAAWFPPLGGGSMTGCNLGPAPLPMGRWTGHTQIATAGPGYLATLKVPLLKGRDFAPTGSNPEVIVNEAFVRAFRPEGEILGQRLAVGAGSDFAPMGTLHEVVGVMGDQRAVGLEKAPEPTVLLSARVIPDRFCWYFLRTRQPLRALAGPIRAQVAALDDQVAVRELTDLDAFVDRKLGDRRQVLLLLSGFALLALLLSCTGIYGVVAFGIARRTREIGLRMALGAPAGRIMRQVLGQGLRPVLAGGVLGLGAFAALSHLLASQLFGIQATDPLTMLLALGLLSQSALLATLLPALRAARIAPAVALRSE